jgi:hypothetical protein
VVQLTMHDRGAGRAGERERPGSGSSGAERGGQDNRALVESGLNAVVQPTTIMEQGVPAGEQWRRLEPTVSIFPSLNWALGQPATLRFQGVSTCYRLYAQRNGPH